MPRPDVVMAWRPASGPARIVRSAATATVCVLAAAAAHLEGGARVPGSAVLVAFAGAFSIAWLLSPRRVTTGQLVGLLVLCQVGVHLTCSGQAMTMSATMLATHALATVVSAAALTRGEAFVWQLAERLGLRIFPVAVTIGQVPFRSRPTPVVLAHSLSDVRLAHLRVERGPPSGSV